jgi:hypothetical protein
MQFWGKKIRHTNRNSNLAPVMTSEFVMKVVRNYTAYPAKPDRPLQEAQDKLGS